MPSPVGHALAGLAAGWAINPGRVGLRESVIFAAAGLAPDIDLLFGAHSGPTHGLGAAVLAGLVTATVASAVSRKRQPTFAGQLQLAVAVIAAYATHTLLDWLGTDSSPPIGIMALWPVSREYFESSLHVFGAISRRYWLPGFWWHNLRAVSWELILLGPIAFVVWRIRASPGVRDGTPGRGAGAESME
jgi:hypothetical protein